MGTTKDIREAVEAELKFDPLVDDADIHVVNISGDVALNGTVPSYPQYLAAAGARRIAGSRDVRNDLEVRLPPGDVRDDTELAKEANDALTLNEAAPVGVAAKATNGDVILTGVVRNATERAAAELLVAALTGVRRVRNDIEVRPGANQP